MKEVWSRYRKLHTWSERLDAELCDCGKPGLWIALNIAGASKIGEREKRGRKFMCDECHVEEMGL
jgi:hypothetical protein